MRIAMGVDLVEIDRLDGLLARNSGAERDIFTEDEIAYCQGKRNRPAHLAARFAAKEAVLKALGTGLGPGQAWTDVEVVATPLGPPRVRLSGVTAQHCLRAGWAGAQVSLSHTGGYALAQAVLLPAHGGPAQDGPSPDGPAQDTAHDEG
ncbi:holo-ACP synthase [Streptomyces kaniharaensis]|uniref:holo-ACP synthase n=1 Tax=Streptomyces kaniharaensis TaxID=212423 RepID=UPI0018A84FED|nr:holo-ACP synthase [Streptomyces kaniharaensis]